MSRSGTGLAALGMWVDRSGAVLVVVREQPLQAAAAAQVNWFGDLGDCDGDARPTLLVAQRTLRVARRRLGVAAWQQVAVVVGADPAGDDGATAGTVLLRACEILGRAGLSLGGVVPVDEAAAAADGAATGSDEVAALTGTAAGHLAVGAAVALLRPAVAPAPPGPVTGSDGLPGWAVQPVD